MVSIGWVVFGFLAIEHLVLLFLFLWNITYNIPVAVLRFSGNKGRPTLVLTKGKKRVRFGIPRLKVRGYKREFRDYLSENYYPTVRGKWGGLVLWEFEDQLLTPVVPYKIERNWSKEQRAQVDELLQRLGKLSGVAFNFDERLHHELRLKAVDDVDNEFLLQEDARVDGQYAGGWRDFLMKYAGHATIIIIAMLLLVGLVLWFDKMPEFASQCYGAAKQAAEQSMIQNAVDAARPPA